MLRQIRPERRGFHHIAMRVSDFDATVKFYTEGLGFAAGASWGVGDKRAIMLDSGNGNFIELFAGGTTESKPEGCYMHLALCSDDCDADIASAKRAGAEITMEPKNVDIPSTPPTKVRIAFCKGLNGEVIEFFQYR